MATHEQTNRGKRDLWLTPPYIFVALGEFDLDPCACPEPRPYPTARNHICLPDDGLAHEWKGRVWCNPPYGDEAAEWLERLALHGRGTALVFARTDTQVWQRVVFPSASGILFLNGRLTFRLPDGTKGRYTGGAPSALIAFGPDDWAKLKQSGLKGHYMEAPNQK